MTALRVFGDENKFAAELRKRLKIANDLQAHLDSARDQMKDAPSIRRGDESGLRGFVEQMKFTQELSKAEEAVSRWLVGNDQLMQKFLGAGAADFRFTPPRRGWTPRDDDAFVRADKCQQEIVDGSARLQGLLDGLPSVARPTVRPPEDRFLEVRASGLIEAPALDSYVRRMSKLNTRAQISEAIGSAKELIEACNRATCDLLGVEFPEGDFPKLGKLVRRELASRQATPPSEKAGRAIDQLFTGMATVELALATLRNELGTGHGRSKLPSGLRPRHGQLAVDTADTHARYLVATLRDLKLI